MVCADLAAAAAAEAEEGRAADTPTPTPPSPHALPQQGLRAVLRGAREAGLGMDPPPPPSAVSDVGGGGSGEGGGVGRGQQRARSALVVLVGAGEWAGVVEAAGATGWAVDGGASSQLAAAMHSLPRLAEGMLPVLLRTQ